MTDQPANPSRPAPDEPATIGYAEALAELESILRELEGSDVDVDHLAVRVTRAAQLIAICRDRISGARAQIDEVLADLDAVVPPVDASPHEPT
jgi:exodeoxyribonuclease VII small subunit